MRLVLLSLLFLAAPAGALTIEIDSVSLGAGNTADSANNASAAEILTASDSVPDVTGGPFAVVDAHWQGSVWADDALASATADWQITFTVTANPGVVYNLVILQELAGAFTFVDDSIGNATGSVGAVSGTLGGLPNPLLTMPVGVDGAQTCCPADPPADPPSFPFQRSRLLELESLVGTQTFTLGFTFDINAQSTTDQIAVQLGLPGSIGAAAYPGIGGRDPSTDGHHLSLSTRVISAPVPEPGTFTLLALGLIGLGRMRWRR